MLSRHNTRQHFSSLDGGAQWPRHFCARFVFALRFSVRTKLWCMGCLRAQRIVGSQCVLQQSRVRKFLCQHIMAHHFHFLRHHTIIHSSHVPHVSEDEYIGMPCDAKPPVCHSRILEAQGYRVPTSVKQHWTQDSTATFTIRIIDEASCDLSPAPLSPWQQRVWQDTEEASKPLLHLQACEIHSSVCTVGFCCTHPISTASVNPAHARERHWMRLRWRHLNGSMESAIDGA